MLFRRIREIEKSPTAAVHAGVVTQNEHTHKYDIQQDTRPTQQTGLNPQPPIHNTTPGPVQRHNNQHATTHYNTQRPITNRQHTLHRQYTAPRPSSSKPAITRWLPSPEQCFNCTRYGHIAADCTFPSSCPYHHTVARHNWANCKSFPEQVKITRDLLKQRRHKQRSFFGVEGTDRHKRLTERLPRFPQLASDVIDPIRHISTSCIPNDESQPPLLPSTLNNRRAYFFLDNGSSCSVVSIDTLKEFGFSLELQPSHTTICGITGNTTSSLGRKVLNIEIGGITFPHSFVVVNKNFPSDSPQTSPTPPPITLLQAAAPPFLPPPLPPGNANDTGSYSRKAADRSNQDRRADRNVTFARSPSPVRNDDLDDPRAHSWTCNDVLPQLTLTATTAIPPFSDLLCNVSASTADGTALVLTDYVRVKGCAALPSLYKIVNGKCQVHLMNLTPVPLEIRGGVPVLNFEFTDLPIREFDLPTPSPVCAASHNPPQTTKPKDLKSFLGLSGFYRPFIKDYGSIAQPLTTLLKEDVPVEWAKETEDSFLQLKALLANAPVLAFPDFELPFVLTNDASSVGLGATLRQKVNGKLRPIAFASRTLKPAERDPHGRRARAIEVLAEYDVTIVYLPGRQNVVADALSRSSLPSPAELQACKSIPFPPSLAKHHEARTTAPVLANAANQPPSEEEIRHAQCEDPIYINIIGKLERSDPLVPVRCLPVQQFYLADSGLLFRRATPKKIKGRRGIVRDVVVIPESLEPRVLQLVHESREAAHCGVYKAIQMARQRFFFPLLITKVKKHVKSCKVCPFFKGSTKGSPALRYIPDFPFEKVSCDTLSGFVTTRSGNKHILVFVDNFTRYCELVPVPNKSAKVVAKAFHDFIQWYTTPMYFSCDNKTEFQNEVMDNLCRIMNVTRVNILPYRPQSNGITERLNGSILTFMRSLVDHTSDNWDDLLLTIQSAINSTFHSSLGNTPYFLLYGTDKRLP
ncbi:hypothetical protein C7M84_012131 [Penaeus vannamei]|uniref:RNA-directed DNA polymerase n=1 Tax=Penaeus vannamei TaxID=6689 RepID=A0A423SZL2_PENVA|nr:hypothetical protein C7M84_012131 [Penaeus vannamei]